MARFIGQIMRGIARALAGGIRLPFDLLGDIGRMLGLSPAATRLPPTGVFDQSIDLETAELRHRLEAAATIVVPAPNLPRQDAGQIVHAYASTDGRSRQGFDMSKLDEHVAIALLTMQPTQLHRLALAGPAACGRWASGCKGIVGVPLPSPNLLRHPDAGKAECVDDGCDTAPCSQSATFRAA
ncbi:hypothetical protein GGQ99_005113 [Aminobacter niigataensis]|uniref:Uncharacterized protein n=1 Tax=Aminobacter niigataensis TaxID=83265 RepID=A0ABR6L9N8_9HYPH|nr:hypothetical protein [Aminobacter niigataensis]MBB4653323.1 hypothetical protein [Aminobacter niigataensis]